MSKTWEERDLEIGTRYVIDMNDCCVRGVINAGEFVGIDEEEDVAVFSNCSVGPSWGSWIAEEVQTS